MSCGLEHAQRSFLVCLRAHGHLAVGCKGALFLCRSLAVVVASDHHVHHEKMLTHESQGNSPMARALRARSGAPGAAATGRARLKTQEVMMQRMAAECAITEADAKTAARYSPIVFWYCKSSRI